MERSPSALSMGSIADHQAILHPAMDCPSRKTSRSSSVFSLVATLVGGGCLSLPYAFQETGVILGLVYLTGSGLLSGYSMRLLLSCSRRTGAQNYEECGEKAFGARMKYLTMGLLTLMTFLASVAYLILARDLASPLVETIILDKDGTSQKTRNIIAMICALPVVPLCFAKSLHSLRFTSLISLVALGVLSVAIVYRAVNRSPINWDEVKLASAKPSETFTALPFMQLSFMAHFNLLPVHVGLRKPTRKRLDQVVFYTIFSAMVFYILISVSGYLYAYDYKCGDRPKLNCKDGVPDDILNAFSAKDTLINVGRFGFLMTILLSYPLLILPCRETLLRLIHELRDPPKHRASSVGTQGEGGNRVRFQEDQNGEVGNGQEGQLQVPFLVAEDCEEEEEPLAIIDSQESPEFRTPHLLRQERREQWMLHHHIQICSKEGSEHIISTTVILILSGFCMASIPGVATVWKFTGSTVCMVLAFVFPSAFYIKIRGGGHFFQSPKKDMRLWTAWGLFVFSIFATIVCTIQSVQ